MPPVTDWVDLTVKAWSADLTVKKHDSTVHPTIYVMLEDGSGYLLDEDGNYIIYDVGGVGLTVPAWSADLTVKEDL